MISYEWDIETVAADEHEDVLDHDHHATIDAYNVERLKLAVRQDNLGDGTFARLVLVRDVGNEAEGLIDRAWAYVEQGALPERFADAGGAAVAAVPKRFHTALTQSLKGH